MKRVQIADIIPPILHKAAMSETLYNSHFHILLQEPHENKGMLIGIDKYEARPMAMVIKDLNYDRREIYQLFAQLLKQTDMRMDGVYIVGSTSGGPLETKIKLRKSRETFELFCRPSDGITLALHTQSPIYILNEMLDLFGFNLPYKYKDVDAPQNGINALVGQLEKVIQAYETELANMSQKAGKISVQAYAEASQKVMEYVFNKKG